MKKIMLMYIMFFMGLVSLGKAYAIETYVYDSSNSSLAPSVNTANVASSSSNVANTNSQEAGELGATASGGKTPTPVSKTADGADYSAGAGDGAAKADIAIDIASLFADRLIRNLIDWIFGEATSNFMSGSVPLWVEGSYFPIFISWNIVDTAITLGHAAVNKFMRDATNITATFTGAEGFVTDKWVGPHPRNTTVAIMGDVSVTSQKFDALAFDASEYKDLENADKASARQLMDYRSQQLIQDQRSLSNVADAQWKLLYRAQQRSIKGLAGALELKDQLAALGEVENRISADYKNKPSALNSVASRRALHDALLLLKMNVMAARTKLRAETLELDFRPMTREPDTVVENVPSGPILTPTTLQ